MLGISAKTGKDEGEQERKTSLNDRIKRNCSGDEPGSGYA